MDLAARQLLRALRGPRSQVAFSRRLGYRSNVVADWEAGRRSPTAHEALRAADRAGVDVDAALGRFHPTGVGVWSTDAPTWLAPWLRALQGSTPQSHVAGRTGRSRHQVGRWLRGTAVPRLPDFLAVVDALTGRVSDLVAELVDIEHVPALSAEHARRRAARRLAFDHPWTSAVLLLLETDAMPAGDPVGPIARALGVDRSIVEDALDRLVAAGVVAREAGRWRVVGPLTVDVAATPADMAVLKRHWTGVARDRVAVPGPDDLHSFNLVAVSRADLARIRELEQAFFREVRSLVAASSPSEVAGLLVHQLVAFDPGA